MMTNLTKTNKQLKKSTEITEFIPNANQERWLNMAIELETDQVKTVAEACGMDRTIWYKWLDIPGFLEWFNEAWNKKLRSHAWRLDVIGLKQSKREYKYWEGMQKRVGNLRDENKSVLIQQNFNTHAENERAQFEE